VDAHGAGRAAERRSCVSRSNCTVVGYYTNTKAVSLTLIETWNGRHWTIANSANP